MKPVLEAPHVIARAGIAAFEKRASHFPWKTGWHYHPEIELTWILKGAGTRLVGDHSDTYGSGDLVLLGSNLPHVWSADASRKSDPLANRGVVIKFHPRLLPDAMLALPDFSSLAQTMVRARLGLHFSRDTVTALRPLLLALLEKRGVDAWLSLVEILSCLSMRSDFTSLASERYRNQRTYRLSSRLERVLTFMDENCGENLDLAAVARVAHLSPNAFSKFFCKMTGKTFVEHRNACRVREACHLLIHTDRSITDIAYQSGFGNLANFNRQFLKQKQLSPFKYRRQHNPP